jgi:hypothetical protein
VHPPSLLDAVEHELGLSLFCARFECGTNVRAILGEPHVAPPRPRGDLPSAEGAQPREERRLAPVRAELEDRPPQRRLDDLLGGVSVVIDPPQGEAVEAIEGLSRGGLLIARSIA